MSIWQDIQRRVGAPVTGAPDDATAQAIAKVIGLSAPHDGSVTIQCAAELIGHEAIVREAYRDSKNIWTWGIGVTNASGHLVHPRYKDSPQPIAKCIEIFLWLLRERYGPHVRQALQGRSYSEAQFAAALSFHYNTGEILTAKWVASWRAGKIDQARKEFMNWRSPASIIPRREKERDLFFDGKWTNDGTALVIPVSKPSYQPSFRAAKRIPIMADLQAAMAVSS